MKYGGAERVFDENSGIIIGGKVSLNRCPQCNFRMPMGNIKPWLGKDYREDIQDDPAYWSLPDVLMSEGLAMASIEEIWENPMAGWGDWTPDGKIDQLYHFWGDYMDFGETGAKVLELGCGGGKQLWAWREFSKRELLDIQLFGVDHSAKAVVAARARMSDITIHIFEANKVDTIAWPFRRADLVYTHTCLQHNSFHKLKEIFNTVHKLLVENGLFWLMNELTIDSKDYVGKYHKDVSMAPWVTDDRGSHGTAAWWIGFIADYGFELLEYHNSSYVFRRV